MPSAWLSVALAAAGIASPAQSQGRAGTGHAVRTLSSHSSSAGIGQSHYSDGHAVIYIDEHVPARAVLLGNSFTGSLPSHSAGHGGHGIANSRHDHHPYRTLEQ